MPSRLSPDRALIAELHLLVERDRHATAHVIAALMEMDARRLYLGEGCSSLFAYCTQVLHFSEHAAYGRIEAARLASRIPTILDYLADGSLTLTSAGLLAPVLTPENHAELVGRRAAQEQAGRRTADRGSSAAAGCALVSAEAPRDQVDRSVGGGPGRRYTAGRRDDRTRQFNARDGSGATRRALRRFDKTGDGGPTGT